MEVPVVESCTISIQGSGRQGIENDDAGMIFPSPSPLSTRGDLFFHESNAKDDFVGGGKGDSTGETAGKAAAGEAKKDKTLEEITLEMLEQLGASVRPARNVPNVEALSWVLEQLRSSNPPSTLDMEWFSMGDPQATELAAALKANSSVTELKLRYNEIRDDGAVALAGALESHESLETLTLGNNMIANRGAEALAVRPRHQHPFAAPRQPLDFLILMPVIMVCAVAESDRVEREGLYLGSALQQRAIGSAVMADMTGSGQHVVDMKLVTTLTDCIAPAC
eukprot:2530674-Rhodomonas_salina.1